jgi:hypothetical protein
MPVMPIYAAVVSVCLAASPHAEGFVARPVSDHVQIVGRAETGSQVGGSQVVVTSQRGLVVFNTFWAANVAREFRQGITDVFHRGDFAYTVNAVDRLDMFGGNAAYDETVIVGHRTFADRYLGKEDAVRAEVAQLIEMWRWKEGVSRDRLAQHPEGSEAAAGELSWMNTCKRRADDLEQGFSLVLPDTTFTDRMSLDLGDVTLNLIWFGRSGNYNGMTVAVIPEDKVAIIPSFILHPQHLAPYPHNEYAELDVPRWLAVLGEVLQGPNAAETVICGIEEVWTREQALPYYDYMTRLWRAVRAADAEGRSLAEVQDQLSFEKDFAFVKEFPAYQHSGDEWFRPQHQGHVKVWYLQGKNVADAMIRKAGLDSLTVALARVRELRDSGSDVYFDEAAINTIGYYLLNEGKSAEAVEVFRLNVEAFPASANAYDSMAEAYMKSGDRVNAIAFYQKSLDLNPANDNARRMLEELRRP